MTILVIENAVTLGAAKNFLSTLGKETFRFAQHDTSRFFQLSKTKCKKPRKKVSDGRITRQNNLNCEAFICRIDAVGTILAAHCVKAITIFVIYYV